MIEVLTWNTDGLELTALDQRAEALCLQTLLVRPWHPHVVMLQEVVARTFHAHFKPHFQAAGFELYPSSPPDTDYFDLLAWRAPLERIDARRIPFDNSVMGRALTEAELRVGEHEIRVVTSHLESLRESSVARIGQLYTVAEHLLGWDGPAVFGGDTNLREAEWKEVASRHPDLRDAWEGAGSPERARYTWEPGENPNIRVKPGPKRGGGMRFDRVLTNAHLVAKGIETIGKIEVEGTGGRFVSDHYGVVARVDLV